MAGKGTSIGDNRERKGFLGWLLADPWRKLIALGLGLVCWYSFRNTISGSVAGQHWFTVDDVQVYLSGSSANAADRYFVITSGNGANCVGEVALALAVDFWHQNSEIKSEQFRVDLPVTELVFQDDGRRAEPLQHEYTIAAGNITEKPAEVTVRSITPRTVTVQWDKYISREIPVQPRIRNWLPGDRSYQARLEPETVTVTGPAFMVNQINLIPTAEMELRDGTVNFDAELELAPPPFKECAYSVDRVKVKIEVSSNSAVVSRRIDSVRVNMLHRMDATLEVDKGSVGSDKVAAIVQGPANLVNRLDEGVISAYCDLTSFSSPGIQNVKIQPLGFPTGVTVKFEPSDYLRLKLVPSYWSSLSVPPTGDGVVPAGDSGSEAGTP